MKFLAGVLALMASLGATAQLRPTHEVLDNGLEVIIVEGHTTPLARIMVVFRAGALAQTRETAGAFHLFEHLAFEGRAGKSANALEQQTALLSLGVSDGNAYTSTQSMAFHFSLPADRLEEGLEYWADRLMNLHIDEESVEAVKGPLLNEIMEGSGAQATDAFWMPFPWRRDVVGHASAIRAADAALMQSIKGRYIVPNNAAVLVAGDVDPQKALEAVRSAFGSWKRADDPWIEDMEPYHALDRRLLYIGQSYGLPTGTALAVRQKAVTGLGIPAGKDGDAGRREGASVLFCELANEPDGRFLSSMAASTRSSNPVRISFQPLPDASIYTISIPFALDKGTVAWGRGLSVAEDGGLMRELRKLAADPAAYFGQDSLMRFKERYRVVREGVRDRPLAYLDELAWTWAAGGAAYALDWRARAMDAGWEDLGSVVKADLLEGEWITILYLSPEDYARERKAAVAYGFTDLSALKAWWRKEASE